MEDSGRIDIGNVRIADEVVAIIAGLAATEVEGCRHERRSRRRDCRASGKRNLSKGVKVEVGDREAAVDLFLVVNYGVSIPEVALSVQRNVSRAISSMTGLNVVEVNVHIQGVHFQVEEKPEEPTRVR